MASANVPENSPPSGTLSPIDKKSARRAIAKRAVPLRILIEDASNTYVFVKAKLLSENPKDVIKELQTALSENPELFRLFVALVKQLPAEDCNDEADELQSTFADFVMFLYDTVLSCSRLEICPCQAGDDLNQKG